MAAYLLFIREDKVRDQTQMDRYSQLNRSNPPKVPMKPLIVYGATQALEGAAPDGTVLLQFANAKEARDWYESEEYQAALPYRQSGADYRALLIEGL